MVVEERAGRIEAAAQLDERLGPGIASEELVSRQEMKLAPMHEVLHHRGRLEPGLWALPGRSSRP